MPTGRHNYEIDADSIRAPGLVDLQAERAKAARAGLDQKLRVAIEAAHERLDGRDMQGIAVVRVSRRYNPMLDVELLQLVGCLHQQRIAVY